MVSINVWDTRVHFPLIQFFLLFESKVYRAKTAFVFHILLPWQRQLWYESTGSPVEYGCGSEFTISQTKYPTWATGIFNEKCVGCKICCIIASSFNPGFMKVRSKALAVFWRAKLSLSVVFLIDKWTVPLKQESFWSYSSPRKRPTSPKCHTAGQRWGIDVLFTLTRKKQDTIYFIASELCQLPQGGRRKSHIVTQLSRPCFELMQQDIVASWSRAAHYHLAGWMHDTEKLFLIKNKYPAWQENE